MFLLTKYKKFLLPFFALALILTLSTAFLPHPENDEQVYLTLAKKIVCNKPNCILFDFSRYNLLGSPILKAVPVKEYFADRFFHPPIFIMVLSLAYRLGGETLVFLVPWFVYLLTVFMIYKTISLLTVSKEIRGNCLLFSVFSPIFMFNAGRLWMDGFIALMTISCFYYFNKGLRDNKMLHYFLSGLFLIFAGLTKYWGIILFPIILLGIILSAKGKNKIIEALLFTAPLLFFIWVIFFSNLRPAMHPSLNQLLGIKNASSINNAEVIFPFVKYVRQRPWYFYLTGLLLINPFLFLFYFPLKKRAFDYYPNKNLIKMIIVICTFLLFFFTLYGLAGGSYQLRYILMLEPFLIILLSFVSLQKTSFAPAFILLVIVHNLLIVFTNSIINRHAELFSFLELFMF